MKKVTILTLGALAVGAIGFALTVSGNRTSISEGGLSGHAEDEGHEDHNGHDDHQREGHHRNEPEGLVELEDAPEAARQ